MKRDVALLCGLKLFSGIDEKDLVPMLDCLGAYEKLYAKSGIIVPDGDALRRIGVVLAGVVHMAKDDIWGGRALLAALRPGEMFGESIVCGGLSSTVVSFQAVQPSRVLFLPFERVLRTCRRTCDFHLRLIENMVRVIAEKNVRLMEKMEIIAKKTMRERILIFLSQEARKVGGREVVVPMGRLELADYLCVDRSALTRELGRMKADGILDFTKNVFVLKDFPRDLLQTLE